MTLYGRAWTSDLATTWLMPYMASAARADQMIAGMCSGWRASAPPTGDQQQGKDQDPGPDRRQDAFVIPGQEAMPPRRGPGEPVDVQVPTLVQNDEPPRVLSRA